MGWRRFFEDLKNMMRACGQKLRKERKECWGALQKGGAAKGNGAVMAGKIDAKPNFKSPRHGKRRL